MPAYQVTRAQVASALGDWVAAREAYAVAAGTDDLPASWLGLAQAQLQVGEPRAAVAASLDRALRIGDQQPGVLYAAADLYDRLGLTAEADEAYAGAIVLMPSLAGDPWWTSDPAMAPRFPGLLEQAIQRSAGSGWIVALMAGDVDRARAAADAAGASDRTRLIIEAWAGDVEAGMSLVAQAGSEPGDAILQSWASLVSERAGDARTADRLRRLATFNWEGGDLPGYRFARQPDADADGVPAGTRGAYYGEWLYRRTMPIRQLPPGLPQLEYVGFDLPAGAPGREVGHTTGEPAGAPAAG
jgi:tetratricopeptide (TPR) repeat protein